MSGSDLPKLARALEYVDLAAALYLAGGSDHAARLLAAAAEQLLGDLCRLLNEQEQNEELQALLRRVAERYAAPRFDARGHAQARGNQQALARAGEMGGLAADESGPAWPPSAAGAQRHVRSGPAPLAGTVRAHRRAGGRAGRGADDAAHG